MGNVRFVRKAAIFIALSAFALSLAGCGPKEVLLYDDSGNHFAAEALNRLNYRFTTVTTMEDFVGVFQSKAWDLLVMDNPSLVDGQTGALPLVDYFVTHGAKAVISTMNIRQWPDLTLWASLGYRSEGFPNLAPMPVYKVNPSFPLWRSPRSAPELDFEGADDLYVNNGFPGSAIGSGTILAVFSKITPATNAAVISANDGRTILNCFLLDDGARSSIPINTDGDSIADSVEWWMNEISYVASQPGVQVKPGPPL